MTKERAMELLNAVIDDKWLLQNINIRLDDVDVKLRARGIAV